MRSGGRTRDFLVADLAVSLEMVTAAEAGSALTRCLEGDGSLLDELTSAAGLSEEQVRKLKQEADLCEAGRSSDLQGRYREFDPIGTGGMGLVYMALDTELNRRVAIKFVRPPTVQRSKTPTPFEIAPPGADSPYNPSYQELVDRFQQEAWLTGGLEHPGIVPVYELGRTPKGVPYYTMRYVKGVRTLESELDRAESLDDRLQLLDPFLQVCDAIRYAHSRGVIHRDLKPANIGLGEFGEVVVLDWGLAKMRDVPDRMESVWQQRIRDLREIRDMNTAVSALGTPGYMSPEAALGDLREVDERSDVYSLGAILHRILTGKLPFDVDQYPVLLQKLREESPPPATSVEPAVPADLSRICAKALAREKPQRYAGAGLLARAIREHQREAAVQSQVLGLVQEAEAAFEGTEGLQGEALLKQLDRIAALCQRVLQRREDHERARELLKECESQRQRAIEEREQAIEKESHEKRVALIRRERERRERLFSRIALVGLVFVAIGIGVVAWLWSAKREKELEAQRKDLKARMALMDAESSRELAEQAAADDKADVKMLQAQLRTERAAVKQANP